MGLWQFQYQKRVQRVRLAAPSSWQLLTDIQIEIGQCTISPRDNLSFNFPFELTVVDGNANMIRYIKFTDVLDAIGNACLAKRE